VLNDNQSELWGKEGVIQTGLGETKTLAIEMQGEIDKFIARVRDPILETGSVWKAWGKFIRQMIITIRKIKEEAQLGGHGSPAGDPEPPKKIEIDGVMQPNPAWEEWYNRQNNPGDTAYGGRQVAGAAHWTGEGGPELVVPQMAGQVISADSIAALFTGQSKGSYHHPKGPGGGGGFTITNLNISVPPGNYTAEELGAAVRDALEDSIINIADRQGMRGEPW